MIVTEDRRETTRILNVILTGSKVREMIIKVSYYLAGVDIALKAPNVFFNET